MYPINFLTSLFLTWQPKYSYFSFEHQLISSSSYKMYYHTQTFNMTSLKFLLCITQLAEDLITIPATWILK